MEKSEREAGGEDTKRKERHNRQTKREKIFIYLCLFLSIHLSFTKSYPRVPPKVPSSSATSKCHPQVPNTVPFLGANLECRPAVPSSGATESAILRGTQSAILGCQPRVPPRCANLLCSPLSLNTILHCNRPSATPFPMPPSQSRKAQRVH